MLDELWIVGALKQSYSKEKMVFLSYGMVGSEYVNHGTKTARVVVLSHCWAFFKSRMRVFLGLAVSFVMIFL